ncbi:MAG: hypothetical protein KC441_15825 [Anaerolineales bacterium]|nr:hypothetical protein [Anaerolineales bacterium]
MNDKRFQQLAAWTAVISVFFAWGTILVSFVAVGLDLETFYASVSQNAAGMLPILANNPSLAWWPSIFDLFGFYLLLIPLALYLWRRFQVQHGQWAALFSVCGLGYLLFGALGAAVLAVVFSSQAAAYAAAGSSEQVVITAVFAAFGEAIQRGVWGILDPLLGGVWWLGIGLLLRRELPPLGWTTIVLGLINLVGGLSAAVRLDAIAGICLNIYFVLAPLWAGWMGLTLLRKGQLAADR